LFHHRVITLSARGCETM